MYKFTFALLTLFITLNSFAQNGWDYLYGNDLFSAQQIFEEDVKKDSLNEKALIGLMLISEITEDQKTFEVSARRLLYKNKNDENFHKILNDFSGFKRQEILDNTNLSLSVKMPYLMGQADKEFYFRNFDKARSIYRENISHLNWSYIGPFKNINGHGFEVKFPIETEEFNAEKNYGYKNRDEYKWVSPDLYDMSGTISFADHLKSTYDGAVYFANSFFELKEATKCQLRVSRSAPIKIWINNQLVFDSWEDVNFEWDGDIINLDIPAGFNRILIKYCPGYYYSGKDGGEYGDYGEGDDYDYGDNFYDSYSYDNNSTGLVLRFTDENGKLISFNSQTTLTNYNKNVTVNEKSSRQAMSYFKSLLEKDEKNITNLYLYYVAARHAGLTDELEEKLFYKLKKYPSNNIIRYLLAETYIDNGKTEIAERTLSPIDLQKFPVFSVIYKDLKQTDSENEAESYLMKCQMLHQISPSNLNIILRILDYYEEKGMDDDKKSFAKEMIKKYPDYEYDLEDYTKDNNKPHDYDIGNDYEYSTKKEVKEATKNIKKYYYISDYKTLISKYKGELKADKVISLYDDILKIEPENQFIRQEKAEYLYNIDRNDAALVELNKILLSRPYDDAIYELMGDIYFNQKNNDKALENYLLAKKYSSGTSDLMWMYGYGGGGVDEKIAKIAGQKQLKNKFINKTYEEMIADESWKEKYGNDESVILGYTSDIFYEKDGSINLYSKMLIKILTEAGANSWTEFNFSFMGDLSLVKVIKKNGAEVVPDRSGSFIVFKNLEPGDLIKLEGSMKASDENELGNLLNGFNILALHASAHYVKVEVAVPENSPLNYYGQKIDHNKVVKTTQDGYDYYRWEFNGVDKMVNEEAIIDMYDLYPILQINTFMDWSPVVEWYQAKTYRKLEPNYEARNVIDSLIKPGMTDLQKVETIYNYIAKDINYSFTRLLQSNYIPKNSDLTICSKIGDCKDVSTLLITLLRMVDIKAYYVLVKTNSYFHMKTLPNLYFDHVITAYELDGKMYYTDPTSDYYPFNVLNENDVDAWGLLIKDGVTEAFQLPHDEIDPEKNLVTYDIDATLNTDRSLKMNVKGNFKGMSGGMVREVYQRTAKENFETELLKFMGKGVFENLDMEKFTLDNPVEITPPLTGTFELSAFSYSDNIDEIQFMRIPFINAVRPSPIISSKKRYNSLNLPDIIDPEPTLQKINVHLPSNYSLRKMPKDVSIDNEFVTYKITFKKDKNGLYIEKYQQFKKTIIPVEEFESFKQVYLKLLEYDRMKITFNVK